MNAKKTLIERILLSVFFWGITDRGSIDNMQGVGREGSSPSPFHPRPPSSALDQIDTSVAADGGNMDNPEMVEVRKKRKDLMEQGLQR